MSLGRRKAGSCSAVRHQFILPGLIALLLFSSPALGQPPGLPAPEQSPILGDPGQEPVTVLKHYRPAPHLTLSSPWCPLPPASVFALHTNLRKYLETWPTPGATAGDDWPEYIAEADADFD